MKKTNLKNKVGGFTLIELLVVITIIGILATIVVVNLNSARGRGQDTAIKEQMSQIRAQAALYYDTQYGYTTGSVSGASGAINCLTSSYTANTSSFPAGSFFLDTDFVRSAQGIQKNSAVIPSCYIGGSTSSGKAQSWVMTAKLRLPTSASLGYWCVDSIGNSLETNGTPVETGVEYSCQ